MGQNKSSLLLPSEIEEIKKETGFSVSQIQRLYHRFQNLDKGDRGALCRQDFLRIPELAINPLGDRIVHAFFAGGRPEVNFRQFIRVLGIFRPIEKKDQHNPDAVNSAKEKLKFAFQMYDLDDDFEISKEELLAILHMMVGENISEEQLLNIADRTMQEADLDHNGYINFAEFTQSLNRVDIRQKMSIRFLH